MNLPRPLFWRVRRKVWRSLIMNAAGLSTLSWTRLGSDDRQPPEPPPPPKRPMKALFLITLAVVLGVFALGMSSCTGIGSGLTGQAPPASPVQRVEGGTPFQVADRDLVRAETSPASTVWGLYSVSNVARATQVVTDAGK